jgi:hypothetical protein
VKVIYILLCLVLHSSVQTDAQEKKLTPEEEAAYTKTITQRADKIVATLGLENAAKASKVRDIIANQYRNLNTIHTKRDNEIKKLKKQQYVDKETLAKEVKKAEEKATVQLTKLHKNYIKQLSAKLNSDQVDKVKDGMTYDVLHVTYNGYNNMIPNLTEDQKKQIMTWLIEARELAMDAESSDKKHAWFGKYKGRINNYLSTAGYDLRKEGDDWQKRLKAKQTTPANK